MSGELERLGDEINSCRRCPRLVEWREERAADPPKRYRGEEYWARPLNGFGDPAARLAIVGLAPAAHGANRTGRMFTGDRSGDWLYAALHRAGLATRPISERRGDDLRLIDAYLTAVVRCAPPANRPTPDERDNCLPYLERELELLTECRAILALGSFAWDGALRALRGPGRRGAAAAAALRPRGRGPGRPLGPGRQLPPEPAEHLHRPPDRADARRRDRPRPRARSLDLAPMRTPGPTTIALAVLAIAVRWRAAGCGSSSDETRPRRSETAAPAARARQEAPGRRPSQRCKSSASVDGEVRVTGVPCELDRSFAAWHKNGDCSAPEGASRTSCKLGRFICLGAVTDRGLAVNCAAPGRSMAFIAKPR